LAIPRVILPATLAWLLLAYYRASAGPPALAVLGGFLGFFLLGFLLERARAVRVLGVRKRRVILSFKNRAGARAFLDANGLAQAAVHESLADAISDAT
ncbi:hypothetical protein HY251_00510, partial [bacterium]|nr:hypothetical protein [bacterium]